MNPFQQALLRNFEKHVELTEDEKALVCSLFMEKQYSKKAIVLAPGNACRYLNYVCSGIVKIYSVDAQQQEHVIFFAIEDWWAVDLKSYVSGDPARFFIEPLEDATVLQIDKVNFQKLLDTVPKIEKWFRILLQNALISTENRIDFELSLSAEERYEMFLKKYPKLESRISQKQIASYLGITAPFLSKMKAKRLNK